MPETREELRARLRAKLKDKREHRSGDSSVQGGNDGIKRAEESMLNTFGEYAQSLSMLSSLIKSPHNAMKELAKMETKNDEPKRQECDYDDDEEAPPLNM